MAAVAQPCGSMSAVSISLMAAVAQPCGSMSAVSITWQRHARSRYSGGAAAVAALM